MTTTERLREMFAVSKRNSFAIQMKTDDLMTGLPGEDLLRQGLADFQAERCTIPACLIQIARPRLTKAGLLLEDIPDVVIEPEPELQMYRLLRQEKGDAYSRYNALLRELISFEMALDCRMERLRAALLIRPQRR